MSLALIFVTAQTETSDLGSQWTEFITVIPYNFLHNSYLAFFLNAAPHHTPVGMKRSSVLSPA